VDRRPGFLVTEKILVTRWGYVGQLSKKNEIQRVVDFILWSFFLKKIFEHKVVVIFSKLFF
jgi:hypothetical protein